MTDEEKQILLKDLCGRLQHNLWVRYEDKNYLVTGYGHGRVSLLPSIFSSAIGPCPLVEEVKPYLRPMSSMTEEEKKEVHYFVESHKFGNCSRSGAISDYLNSIHIDYRGLIEKGLALEAPEDMYKEE